MIWPPSVRGILVTEGVRGEGGVLHNSEGRRFMFDDIPENYRAQTADNEEEGWRYTQGDKNARRPPELLTRDHVARCIMREVEEGRGSPHGGVFLDIAWIKEQLPNARGAHQEEAAEHVPPVQAAGRHRHHQGADGGRPDDALHHGRRPGGRRHADVDRARACSPPASAPPGINGANRLGGNSLSDLLVFGKRAGEYAAQVRAGRTATATIDAGAGRRGGAARAGAVRARRAAARVRTRCSTTLQEMMQDLVGIVRTRGARCSARSTGIDAAAASGRARVGVAGNREYNPGWHTALDLRQPADRLGGDHARGARAEGEPRRPLPRRLSRTRTRRSARSTSSSARGRTARCSSPREPIPTMPAELKQIIEEMK